LSGAPETIRTSDPCLRRAVLYPAELRARVLKLLIAIDLVLYFFLLSSIA